MLDLIRQILETTIFSSSEKDNSSFVCIEKDNNESIENRAKSGEFYIPKDMFPTSCQIKSLSTGEDFLKEVQDFISELQPRNLFVIPPFISSRDLKTLQQEFPRWDLPSIILKKAIDSLPTKSNLGIIVPEGFRSHQNYLSAREYLFTHANLQFVISLNNSQCLFKGVHSSFKFCILIIETGQPTKIPVKFFEVPTRSKNILTSKRIEGSELIEDFLKLAAKNGGETKYGYVHRESIESGRNLIHAKYHPKFIKKQKDLNEYGSIQQLKDLCEIYQSSIHIHNDAHKLISSNSSECPKGISLISGKEILSNGRLDIENIQFRIIDTSTNLLKEGDICIRRLVGNDSNLKCAEVSHDIDILPVASANNVLVLRFKSDIISIDREITLEYLRSEQAIEWLKNQGMALEVNWAILKELPVPLFDNDLRNAFRSLKEASKQFDEWRKMAEESRNSLFKSKSAKDSRLFLLSTGREARQREEAAKLIDNFDYRIRTRLPHPIAYRWRTVKSSHENLEGYKDILECAEVTICYLAHIAIILAQHKQISIGHIKNVMATRFIKTGHGTNFGDWVAILREVRDSKKFNALTGYIPFYEILKFLETKEVDLALQTLSDLRNDDSHGRSPKGHDIPKKYKKAIENLEILLKGAEFASEYPLRYIEDTKRDTFKKTTSYSYRDLMGDHPLVPIQSSHTSEPEVEKGSLYLVDRDENLYLLRPFLSRRQCPECGTWATFYFDSYIKNKDTVTIKSMEHNHTTQDSNIASILREVGFLSTIQQESKSNDK